MVLPALKKVKQSGYGSWGQWFLGAVADYYLYHIMALFGPKVKRGERSEYETLLDAHRSDLGEQMARYLVTACGGELHYARHQAVEYLNQYFADNGPFKDFDFPAAGGERSDRWRSWDAMLQPETTDTAVVAKAMRAAQKAFESPAGWGGSTGGPAWARGAELCAQYLEGELSAAVFVEFALNLHHNCGIIFNKMGGNEILLKSILDIGANYIGDTKDETILLNNGTKEVRTIWNQWLVAVGREQPGAASAFAAATETEPSTSPPSTEDPPTTAPTPKAPSHSTTTKKKSTEWWA